jgi:amino acid permease
MGPVYDQGMLAVVWHYWIGVAIVVPALLLTVVMVGQYLSKTQAPKYGRDD